MRNYLEDLVGVTYSEYAFWAIWAVAALIAILILYAIVRRMTSGTYVAGGRNRTPRLAVTDAAAVDSHRRLVLVRRDDVEHLILIGGPSDIVIEQDIRINARRAEAAEARRTDAPEAPRPAMQQAEAPLPPAREPYVPTRLPEPPRLPEISRQPAAPRPIVAERRPEPPRVPPVIRAPAKPSAPAAPPAPPAAPQSPFRSGGLFSSRKGHAEALPGSAPVKTGAAAVRAGIMPPPAKPSAEDFEFDDELMADLSAQLRLEEARNPAAEAEIDQIFAELNKKPV